MPDADYLFDEWQRALAQFPVLKSYGLQRTPLDGARVGQCRLRRGVIVVEPGLPPALARKVLGHEIAHALLGRGGHEAAFVQRLLQVYVALDYLDAETAAELRDERAQCSQVERAALAYLRGRTPR